jgi:hypothetical protein
MTWMMGSIGIAMIFLGNPTVIPCKIPEIPLKIIKHQHFLLVKSVKSVKLPSGKLT